VWLQVVNNAFGVFLREGVVRVGAAFHRMNSRVEVVPCRRTHGRCLKAVRESHSL